MANKKKVVVQVRPKQPAKKNQSTRRSAQSVLVPPQTNMASSAGQQSEIALQVRKGLSTLTIHPDNTRWLGEAAPSFQKWGMHDLTLRYEPRVATSTNGQVALTFLSDFADRSPSSLEDTVTLAGARRGAPWSTFSVPKQRNRLFDYCSLSDFEAGDATTKNDRSPGRIICWADMDSGVPDDDVIGWVYVTYRPVLQHPILRKLQIGGAGGGTQNPGAELGLSDYYYKETPYTTAWDFMGLNPTYDINRVDAITGNVGYIYNPDVKSCVVANFGERSVKMFFSIILRDYSKISTRESLLFKHYRCHFFEGNKGFYAAWDNGDVMYRLVGELEPGAWFYLDNSLLTSWRTCEIYAFELGTEHTNAVLGTQVKALTNGVTTDRAFTSKEAAVPMTISSSGGFNMNMGASTRQTTSVGFQGVGDSSTTVSDGVEFLTGSRALATNLGLTKPNNQLLVAFRNNSQENRFLNVTMLFTDFKLKYETTPITAVVSAGTVFDSRTVDICSISTVFLPPGASVIWTLAVRASVIPDGTQAMEGVGAGYIAALVSRTSTWYTSLPSPRTITTLQSQ